MIWLYIFILLITVLALTVLIINLINIPLIFKYKNISKDFHINFQKDSIEYYDFPKWSDWFNPYKNSIKNKNARKLRLFLVKSSKTIINEFNQIIDRTTINNFNDHFVKQKIEQHNDFLQNIEKYPFDNNQLTSIVHDEVNNLVIAGAGTGKTSTIIGKASYLTNIQNIDEKHILILAFTNKAVDNMQDRLDAISLGNLKIKTFHSFGYEIISNTGVRKDIAFTEKSKEKLYDFIEKTIKNLLSNDIDFRKKVHQYFKYYIDNRKAVDISSKWKTKKGEEVKSFQELVIANFLAANNIKYTYEKNYGIKTSSKKFRQYQPDFYLDDYNIYIEHFALDKNNEPPKSWGKRKGNKYIEGITWKRNLHNQNKTELLETFSRDFDNGDFNTTFTKKLRKFNVEINEDYSVDNIYKISQDKWQFYYLFTDLLAKFLQLFKSNNYSIEKLYNNKNRIYPEKANCFISIFSKVYWVYEDYLKLIDKIDFSDMISQSTTLLKHNKITYKFDYVLVDEFQDISYGRYDLLLALRKQNPKLKMFCVGDDWQSIYRFTGSDINLFYAFEEYFGFTKKCEITNTYRFSSELASLTEKFITRNPLQIKKAIEANKSLNSKPFKIFYYNYNVLDIFEKIINSIRREQKKCTLLILGRYNFTLTKYNNSISKIKTRYKDIIAIEAMTVHKAKGKEADYVILLDVIEGKKGFPSQVTDDDVLNLVLLSDEQYPYAEERRLFYVAMTRTKNMFFIVNERTEISPFIYEIVDLYGENEDNECPKCNGKLIRRDTGPYGSFLGCQNYPKCRYTKKIIS